MCLMILGRAQARVHAGRINLSLGSRCALNFELSEAGHRQEGRSTEKTPRDGDKSPPTSPAPPPT